MASVSIRKFIRWLPDEASEPTSTLVLTSPGRRYVDIRVLLPESGTGALSEDEEILSLDRLDWAIAGTSASETFPDGHSHSRWMHWIDSRTLDAEAASDEGDMYPQPDHLTLEKGRMVNPATGKETEYEEMWYDPLLKDTICNVLQMEDEEKGKRGLFVCLGEWAQVLVREGEDVMAERWMWTSKGGWKRKVRVGRAREMPCERILKGEGIVRIGDKIQAGDDVWTVLEIDVL